ncbi:CAP domain-containing protein, partial [Salmonella sp. s54925]|uniref:CAP domain-containing protein n=1 Tax=Salmonella sp. s54925 TaxID=3159674 RepID=UPI00397FD16F
AVEKWYSEITKFSFADPEIKPETRDFTQIIWQGSKQLGMGFGNSPGTKKSVVVALYSPAGNKEDDINMNLNLANNDPYADIRKADIQKHA